MKVIRFINDTWAILPRRSALCNWMCKVCENWGDEPAIRSRQFCIMRMHKHTPSFVTSFIALLRVFLKEGSRLEGSEKFKRGSRENFPICSFTYDPGGGSDTNVPLNAFVCFLPHPTPLPGK